MNLARLCPVRPVCGRILARHEAGDLQFDRHFNVAPTQSLSERQRYSFGRPNASSSRADAVGLATGKQSTAHTHTGCYAATYLIRNGFTHGKSTRKALRAPGVNPGLNFTSLTRYLTCNVTSTQACGKAGVHGCALTSTREHAHHTPETCSSGDSDVLVTIRGKCTSPCSVPGGNCDAITPRAIPIGKTCRSQKPPAAPEQADSKP